MKKLLIALGLLSGVAYSQNTTVVTVSSNVAAVVLDSKYTVTELKVINSESSVKTFNFYDTAAATNVDVWITPAWTEYIRYTTNMTSVFTNQTGVVVTNTFSGVYTAAVSHSASTNTYPTLLSVAVPASGSVTISRTIPLGFGLSVKANGAGAVQCTYQR